ncbi:MAG: secretin N-terminal domain-containing protein [Candidatus Omnitrophica bacterium]|nr:secretin N-terminal domain-containing protein [Candidatus Omnitrophota bacterium]
MKALLTLFLAFIICINPCRTAYAQNFGRPQDQPEEKLSLDIKGMDILDVFRLLSMKGGINIIAGKNVTGKVTLFLKGVDIWDAFEIIIAANGLAYENRNNIIYVMTERDYELMYGKKYEDRRIVKSVKLHNVTAAEVLKSVSQLKTNIGKVVSDDVSETIVLMDIPETVAEMENVIEVLDVPLTTKVYNLQYAKANDLKDRLSEILTKNTGSIHIDERTNKIAVTDLKNQIPVFDKLIEAFDEKHKEVIIEAKVLQITLNDDYNTGINWDAVFTKMQSKLHQVATLGVSLRYGDQQQVIPTVATTANGGALQIGNLATEGYQAVIQALREYGKTNLLSSPRIVALNNEEASILVGTNQPYATRTISQGSGGTGNIEAENVTFIDLGIKLIVTPTINDENYITMKIKPEVSSKIGDFQITSSGNVIPIVKTTTTETTVMVKNGSTVLIGGLMEENIRESLREVPGLANIPLLGNLFRTRTIGSGDSTNPEKTELVIFLTPHIISGYEANDLLTVNKVAQEKAVDNISARRGMTNDMDADEYYGLIASIINKKVEQEKPGESLHGEVFISFEINSKGELVSKPVISKGDNPGLSQLGIKSVTEAAPFPPFPKRITSDKETLQIAISYQ